MCSRGVIHGPEFFSVAKLAWKDDDVYKDLKASLLRTGKGRPKALKDMHINNKLLVQLAYLKEEGGTHWKAAGMGINPPTDVEVVLPYIDLVDCILVMTVNPGFGGQKFIHDSVSKIEYLSNKYKQLDIGVDGGEGLKTIQECADAGANLIVSGSAPVGHPNPPDCIAQMRNIVHTALQKIHLER